MSGSRMNIKNRKKLGRGKATFDGSYKTGINIREARSSGVSSIVFNPKTHKSLHLLSEGECRWFAHLWYDETVKDIIEQVFLDDEIVKLICKKNSAVIRRDLSTDLLVLRQDGSKDAYSVKCNKKDFTDEEKERIGIEQVYWEEQGVRFHLVYKEDISKEEYNNIFDVFPFWNPERVDVNNDFSVMRHLIARRIVEIDITQKLNYKELIKNHKQEIELWRKYFTEN